MWAGMLQVAEPLPTSLTLVTINSSAAGKFLSARHSCKLMAEMLGNTSTVYKQTTQKIYQ